MWDTIWIIGRRHKVISTESLRINRLVRYHEHENVVDWEGFLFCGNKSLRFKVAEIPAGN